MAAAQFVPPETCVGDRNDDGAVSVSEIIHGVKLALGVGSDFCGAFDADKNLRVDINDLVAAVDDALHGCGGGRRVDVSEFKEFHFMRTHGLGFCPPAHAVFEVSIERDVNGLLLQLSTLEEEPQSEDCLPGVVPEDRCLVVRSQLARYLRSDEVAQLAGTFDGVVVRNAPASECRGCFIDPCVITTMQWDSLHTTDYICSERNRIDDAQQDAIIEMLEMLRQ